MFDGFWQLCAAYKYNTKLGELTKAAVIWLVLIVAAFVWSLAELILALAG